MKDDSGVKSVDIFFPRLRLGHDGFAGNTPTSRLSVGKIDTHKEEQLVSVSVCSYKWTHGHRQMVSNKVLLEAYPIRHPVPDCVVMVERLQCSLQ